MSKWRQHTIAPTELESFEPEIDIASDTGPEGKWKYMVMRPRAATGKIRFTVMSMDAARGEYDNLAEAIRDYNAR